MLFRSGFIVGCRRLGLSVEAIAALLRQRDALTPPAFRSELERTLLDHRDHLRLVRADIESQLEATGYWLAELRAA